MADASSYFRNTGICEQCSFVEGEKILKWKRLFPFSKRNNGTMSAMIAMYQQKWRKSMEVSISKPIFEEKRLIAYGQSTYFNL